jgi:probable phosphoglycerate mutase
MQMLYLVRHGQTTYNRDGLVQDGSSHLTETGVHQAHRLAERVQHLSFAHLLVSDYERTKETAAPIAEYTGMDPVYTPLLREIRRPSEFWHQPRATPEYQAFLAAASAHYGDPSWRYSDEENFTDVDQRVTELLAFVRTHEGDVLAVTHGHLVRFITAKVLAGTAFSPTFWQQAEHNAKASNTGITALFFDEELDRWCLLTFNDHAHFAE